MAGLEARLFPYTRDIPVHFSPAQSAYVADLARPPAAASWTALAGAHSTVARLVLASKAPRGVCVRRGMAGMGVGDQVHRNLEHFFAHGAPAPNEHRLSVTLRAALAPHMRGARVVPELDAAAPALGMATSIDAVACRGSHVFVIEYKTGYHGVFDTAPAGRWRATVAPALAAAGIKCTPGGRAAAQAFLGALAMQDTFGVPLECMTVVVARAWAGAAGPNTAIRAYPLSTPAYRAVADALRRALGRKRRAAKSALPARRTAADVLRRAAGRAQRAARAVSSANVGRRRGPVRERQ